MKRFHCFNVTQIEASITAIGIFLLGVTETGADAKALYPSLKGKHTAKVVRDAALKTELRELL